jgi:hypothetical protein
MAKNEELINHWIALESLAVPSEEKPNVNRGKLIWLRLMPIERFLHEKGIQYCNGKIDFNQWEKHAAWATEQVKRILGKLPEGFMCNSDARGYALKVDDAIAANIPGIYRDMGGYGILCPDRREQ